MRYTRREFLQAGAALAAAPDPAIVDTHMHVWSLDAQRYPVKPPEPNVRPQTVDGSAERLIEEMRQQGVGRSVLVQIRQYGWDNRYVSDCMRRYPQLFVGHGLIDPHDPQNAAVLEREVRDNGLAGMRLSPIYQPKEQWLNSPANYPLWRKAQELGVVFNVFLAPAQIPQLEGMVRRFPRVKVVVDHLGRPEILSRPPWVENDSLLRLARHANVWVKFSELYTASKSKTYPFRDVHPFGQRVYEAFGAKRLLFGTGMVGSTRRISLADELRLIREDVPFFTSSDKEWILGRNALSIWKWK